MPGILRRMTATPTSAATATPTFKDKDLERLIAAIIAAAAWYVERSLEIPMLCEADVIATCFDPLARRMVEAKSGKCGASDAFKFESQRRFLDIDEGAMVVPSAAPAEMDEVAAWGAFAVLRTDLTRVKVEAAVTAWLGATPSATTIDAWLRGFVVMDALVSQVSDSKARLASPTITAAWTAFHGVNAPTWMRMTLVQRSMTAYAAFGAAPHAGRARADEIGAASGVDGKDVFRESWAGGKHPSIHALLLLEWLNRLEVVRLAVESSLLPPAPPRRGLIVPTPPRAFLDGVDALRTRPDIAPKLPMLLQSFIFRWGGFLIPGVGEEDAIGSDLGLSGTQVRDGLALLDTIFPIGSASWMRATIGAEWLTLVPYPLQGIGVIHRDETKPGWDTTLNGTVRRAFREREGGARPYL